MDHVAMLEAQKDRESDWVDDGAAAFMRRLETADPTMTPAGKGILKLTAKGFQARLARYVEEHAATPRPMQSPTFQIIMALGVPHTAAVTLHVAIGCVISFGATREPTNRTAITAAKNLAEALESDLRFRVWRKDAQDAEKRAVARMRENMVGDPKTWRTRAKLLRTLAEVPWDPETISVVGMDMLGMLVESAPGVFEARQVVYGHKTLLVWDLTKETAERLSLDTQAMSTMRPKLGMMLVPPRAWRYAEKTP